MIQVRQGCFETNSSSTHAICLPKNPRTEITKFSFWFYEDLEEDECQFDRQPYKYVNGWTYKLAYLYMVVVDNCTTSYTKNFKARVNKIFNVCIDKYYPDYAIHSDMTPTKVWKTIENPNFDAWVDHSLKDSFYEWDDFKSTILDNDDNLKNFLFNDASYITIGGDESRGYNLKTLGFNADYYDVYGEEGAKIWEQKVEEYRKSNFVFFKGN